MKLQERFLNEVDDPDLYWTKVEAAKSLFRLVENGGCRHKKILGHFGEEIDACGTSCDWCTGIKAEDRAAEGMTTAAEGMMAAAVVAPRRRSPKSYDRVAEPGPLSDEGEALFQRLREVRKSIADQQSVPAYIVFSDKTLRAMAEARPSTPQELLAVSGVGPLKLERYGQAFMEVIGRAAPAEESAIGR